MSAVMAVSAIFTTEACGSIGPNEHCNPAACDYVPPTRPAPYSPSPEPNNPDYWWQVVDACTLLPVATRTRLGLPIQGQSNGDLATHGCSWTSLQQIFLDVVLSAAVYDQLVLISGDQVTDFTTADGRPGREVIELAKAQCSLTVQATAGSRLSIDLVLAHGTPAQACDQAREVANAMAPNLPASPHATSTTPASLRDTTPSAH